VQPPPPALFVPVKAAVTPPTGNNRPFLGEDAAASFQAMPVNPFRRVAKGMERLSGTQNYT